MLSGDEGYSVANLMGPSGTRVGLLNLAGYMGNVLIEPFTCEAFAQENFQSARLTWQVRFYRALQPPNHDAERLIQINNFLDKWR
jgi:hypothetical protein